MSLRVIVNMTSAVETEDRTRVTQRRVQKPLRTAPPVNAAPLIYLDRTDPQRCRQSVAAAASQAVATDCDRIILVSSFLAHFGDAATLRCETEAKAAIADQPLKVLIVRTGFVLDDINERRLRRWAWLYPLLPASLATCWIESRELAVLLTRECQRLKLPAYRAVTILGRHRPWSEVLRDHFESTIRGRIGAAFAHIARYLLIGYWMMMLLSVARRFSARARAASFATLAPTSLSELLELSNPLNQRFVKIVGYNNGVVHFGQKFSGRTIVSTVGCCRIVRMRHDTLTADAGATIRQASEYLARHGQELHVLPNYSYVTLGTAFFVPIHGSASQYSTLAETIQRATVYDAANDRIVMVRRGQPQFHSMIYDLSRPVVVLRLRVSTKPKAQYFLEKSSLEQPSALDLIHSLQDQRYANVEIRKANSATNVVHVYRYSTNEGLTAGLPFPRDRVGRVWDAIESRRVTAHLFHWLVRRYGFHVELFLTADQFAVFWSTHHQIPLKKIQIRYIRRDPSVHSPFRDHDCISVDVFMWRRHRAPFENFIKAVVPNVRFNPGKHSM
jgi:hypothetical protein